ncbi:SSU ribosomal protein S5p (S2e) [Candidatus Vidania fulgoroideae]|nr:SSU ribosomal protein S5p (S2e) [Candidatus Vidania fulgoroideae]
MNNIIFSRKTTFVRYGGRHFRFSVYSVFSNKNSIGIGFGKSSNFSDAISKSFDNSKKESFEIKIKKNTFPFETSARVCKTNIRIIPTDKDTGIVAGDIIRIIFRNTRIKNLYSKVFGSKNKVNTIKAITMILKKIKLSKKKK